jgi:hypothetical protein
MRPAPDTNQWDLAMQRRQYSQVLCFLAALLAPALQVLPQEVRYGTGSWDPDSFGNHRAVLEVEKNSDAVWARIPWRRRDPEPERKNIIIVEGKTGRRVTNLCRVDINRAFGDIVFQAQNTGTYYVYYLPYTSQGRNYPKVTYPGPDYAGDRDWLARHGLNTEARLQSRKDTFPQATLVEIQAIDEFDSFSPMELTATPEEVGELLRAHSGKPYLVFPEDRSFPIRMSDDLPYRWIKDNLKSEFTGQAERNEFYTFQIGLFASTQDIEGIDLKFSNLINPETKYAISASAWRCFNTGGVNWDGTPLSKVVSVKRGEVRALWFGVQIPGEAPAGHYRGKVDITPGGMPTQTVQLKLNVVGHIIPNSGDDEPWRHSRLRWLDSGLAFDDEVVRPFSPVTVNGSALEILGRRLAIGATGLPEQIESFFSPEVTRIVDRGTTLLSSPVELIVEDVAGAPLPWKTSPPKLTRQNPGLVEWKATSASGSVTMAVQASMEFDGFVHFQIALSASALLEVNDIRLEIPLAREVAKYMMGLGLKGGFRPSSYDWTWDVKKNQDGAWIGDANAGLQFSLRAENYSRPLNTNFYQSKPLNMPPSWFNEGRGGISIREADDNTLRVRSYSGKRTLQPGQDLHFDFNLLLTPFRPLDTSFQWSTRFFHSFKPLMRLSARVPTPSTSTTPTMPTLTLIIPSFTRNR